MRVTYNLTTHHTQRNAVSPVEPVDVDEDELLDGTANDAAMQTQQMVCVSSSS